MMTRFIIRVLVPVAMACWLPGCSKSESPVNTAHYDQLFAASPWQNEWKAVSTATKTNGYVAAITALQKLQVQNLGAEQRDAVKATLVSLNASLLDGVAKGDADAQQAFKQLQERELRNRLHPRQ